MQMGQPQQLFAVPRAHRNERGRLGFRHRPDALLHQRATSLGKVQVRAAPLLHPKLHEARALELMHRRVHRLLSQARRHAHVPLQTAVAQIVEPVQDTESAVGQSHLHGYVVVQLVLEPEQVVVFPIRTVVARIHVSLRSLTSLISYSRKYKYEIRLVKRVHETIMPLPVTRCRLVILSERERNTQSS